MNQIYTTRYDDYIITDNLFCRHSPIKWANGMRLTRELFL